MGNLTAAEIVQGLSERFLPEKAAGYSGIVHYDLSGDGGGQFTVTVDKGTCKIETGLHGNPSCVFQAAAQVYCDIELGKTKPEMAFLTGKIKVSKPQEMIKIVGFFKKLAG